MSNGRTPRQQGEQREPVVEDESLPTMAAEPEDRLPKRGRLMAGKPKAERGKRTMKPFRKGVRPKRTELGEMEPRKGAEASEGKERYLRLTVRVEGDQLRVVDAQTVAGPVAAVEPHLSGALAFEATFGDRQLALGSIPDPGTLRSFPSPDGPPELQVHNIIQPDTFDFTVRIPSHDLPRSAAPKIAITLHRVKGGELRPIARLDGIKKDNADPRVVRDVKTHLG